jgi:hypothetical protein
MMNLPMDTKVCPVWKPSHLNILLHKAAKELGWSTMVTWNGVHQLRHGVLSEVASKHGLDAARMISGHVKAVPSEGTILRYSFTLEERIENAAVNVPATPFRRADPQSSATNIGNAGAISGKKRGRPLGSRNKPKPPGGILEPRVKENDQVDHRKKGKMAL